MCDIEDIRILVDMYNGRNKEIRWVSRYVDIGLERIRVTILSNVSKVVCCDTCSNRLYCSSMYLSSVDRRDIGVV